MLFKTYGDRNRPAVLFFHAMGVTGESSEPVAKHLQEHCFCILPTATVYCAGQRYISKADEVRQVEDFLRAQGVKRLALVVASSIGADLAMAFLTQTALPVGHIFFDGGQFAQIGKAARRIMTPFLYLAMAIPECISIQRYDSISGEELNPYRRLSAGDIQTIVGGKQRYRALIHKRIPIHSVGVEILPAYYEDFLKKHYPDIYFDLPAAFQSVDQAADFPAMSKLLFEIGNYRGEGAAAALFYEAKVTEAIALVVDAWKRQSQKRERPLSAADQESLQNVVSYIADHYAFDLPLERLASIACMSETKLKGCFKRQFGCSVTQYIQGRRMSQAEHLLIDTDFTMGQIAQMIGYTTSSRFAELFKKSTGILPIEYRKIARDK